MSKYRHISFDMDGTLLNSSKQISDDIVEAIKRAVAAGKIVTLSTGRSQPELEQYREVISCMSAVCCAGGGMIFSAVDFKPIYMNPLPRDTVIELFNRTEGLNLMCHLQGTVSMCQKDKACRMADFSMGKFQALFDATGQVENLREYFTKENPPVCKFSCYNHDLATREALKNAISDLDISYTYAETCSLECSAKGVSKASGLKELCRIFGVSLEETIAVGDADNDLELLKAAGLAVVMGNGCENAKRLADVIVADNDHGGCVEAIEKYLLA